MNELKWLKDITSYPPLVLTEETTIEKAWEQICNTTDQEKVPVVDKENRFKGFIEKHTLKSALQQGKDPFEPIKTLSLHKEMVFYEGAPFWPASNDVSSFAVIDKEGSFKGTVLSSHMKKTWNEKVWYPFKLLHGFFHEWNNPVLLVSQEKEVIFANEAAKEMVGKEIRPGKDRLDQILSEKESLHLFNADHISESVSTVIRETLYTIEKLYFTPFDQVTVTGFVFMQKRSEEVAEERTKALETVIESLYDGIVTVDQKGLITMLSNEYADFLGVDPKKVIGRHCTEVIENTRMHIVVKTGKAEIADMQKLKGDYMVASRIPIIKNGEVIGAVGKVLYKNVSGFNALHKRIKKMEQELKQYKGQLKEETKAKYHFSSIIGESLALQEAKEIAQKAASSESNVLLLGESGTGKELFAHSIHNASTRALGSFVKVNCAAIPSDLLESELFGYVEGSFTGAKKGGKKGKFEAADGGTIFLDEIGELPLHMQVKFLRVLQEKEVERIGSAYSTPVNVRIIAATNRDLEAMMSEGEFRTDLFYRLNVMAVTIPSLRERDRDVLLLAEHFRKKLMNQIGKNVSGIGPEAQQYLMHYPWPGNIRELENVMERALNMAEGGEIISVTHLPSKITGRMGALSVQPLDELLRQTEKKALQDCLYQTGGNKTKAAKLLGVSRTSLYEKLQKYSLNG
ncbi:sigma 54-interacting transcriptional regulator [Bacillus sp. FJAT-44742]|uniref:sigma 54-interacting transcriptional regulator n=1 Tax=Bacillus sp. FJAT-44742 TaxID=2014005 RepID=UPI0012FF342B|nr:sigma 54-interacting transcriptional regulator [Bacillus sp. FJAT-44742]